MHTPAELISRQALAAGAALHGAWTRVRLRSRAGLERARQKPRRARDILAGLSAPHPSETPVLQVLMRDLIFAVRFGMVTLMLGAVIVWVSYLRPWTSERRPEGLGDVWGWLTEPRPTWDPAAHLALLAAIVLPLFVATAVGRSRKRQTGMVADEAQRLDDEATAVGLQVVTSVVCLLGAALSWALVPAAAYAGGMPALNVAAGLLLAMLFVALASLDHPSAEARRLSRARAEVRVQRLLCAKTRIDAVLVPRPGADPARERPPFESNTVPWAVVVLGVEVGLMVALVGIAWQGWAHGDASGWAVAGWLAMCPTFGALMMSVGSTAIISARVSRVVSGSALSRLVIIGVWAIVLFVSSLAVVLVWNRLFGVALLLLLVLVLPFVLPWALEGSGLMDRLLERSVDRQLETTRRWLATVANFSGVPPAAGESRSR